MKNKNRRPGRKNTRKLKNKFKNQMENPTYYLAQQKQKIVNISNLNISTLQEPEGQSTLWYTNTLN